MGRVMAGTINRDKGREGALILGHPSLHCFSLYDSLVRGTKERIKNQTVGKQFLRGEFLEQIIITYILFYKRIIQSTLVERGRKIE